MSDADLSLGNGAEWLGTIVCAYTHSAHVHQLQSVQDLLVNPACALCTPVWERAVYGNMRSAASQLPAPASRPAAESQAEISQAAASGAGGDEKHTSDKGEEDGGDDETDDDDDASTGWGTSSEACSPTSPEQETVSTQTPNSREAEPLDQTGTAAATTAGPSTNQNGSHVHVNHLRQFTYFLLHSFLGTRSQRSPNTPLGTFSMINSHAQSNSAAQLQLPVTGEQSAAVSQQLPSATAAQLLVLGQQLWQHRLMDCNHDSVSGECSYPGCTEARQVLLHLLTCTGRGCWLCQASRLHFTPGCPDLLLALHNPRLLLPEGQEQVNLQEWLQAVRAAILQLPVM